jgi:hypothetical protein
VFKSRVVNIQTIERIVLVDGILAPYKNEKNQQFNLETKINYYFIKIAFR